MPVSNDQFHFQIQGGAGESEELEELDASGVHGPQEGSFSPFPEEDGCIVDVLVLDPEANRLLPGFLRNRPLGGKRPPLPRTGGAYQAHKGDRPCQAEAHSLPDFTDR